MCVCVCVCVCVVHIYVDNCVCFIFYTFAVEYLHESEIWCIRDCNINIILYAVCRRGCEYVVLVHSFCYSRFLTLLISGNLHSME